MINVYNLLYLTKKLRRCASETARRLVENHFRVFDAYLTSNQSGGNYDFSESVSADPVFDLAALMELALPDNLRHQ